MTIYIEVNNNPQDINEFVENTLSLPYRVIKTTLIPESEQVLIELNWFSLDTDVILEFHQLSNIKDIYKVIQSKVGKWNQIQ